jgi:hypothetical protein
LRLIVRVGRRRLAEEEGDQRDVDKHEEVDGVDWEEGRRKVGEKWQG